MLELHAHGSEQSRLLPTPPVFHPCNHCVLCQAELDAHCAALPGPCWNTPLAARGRHAGELEINVLIVVYAGLGSVSWGWGL